MADIVATNAREFSLGIAAFKKLGYQAAVHAKGKVALDLQRGLVTANPVDTGRMRAGWHICVGAPDDWKPAIGEAFGTRFRNYGSVPLATPLFVVDNVEYSGFVNDRHPTSAGFVEATIENVAAQIGGGA